MPEGPPLSPEDMGLGEDELDDLKPNPEQEQSIQTTQLDDSDSGASESGSETSGSGSLNTDQTKLSQSAGGSHSAANKHGGSSHGEGVIKSIEEGVDAIAKEVDITGLSK
jgi:hypothetical protein